MKPPLYLKVTRRCAATLIAGMAVLPQPAMAADTRPLAAIVWTAESCGDKPEEQGQTKALFGTLLTLFLPTLVERGVKLLGGAFAKAGAPTDRHIWAQHSLSLYQTSFQDSQEGLSEIPDIGFSNGCVAMAVGPKRAGYSGNLQLELTGEKPLVAGNGTQPVTLGSDVSADLGAAFDLSRTHILAAELQQSPDGTAFRLIPAYISIGGAFRGSATARRDVALTFSVLEPGALADGGVTVVRTISFPNVTASKSVTGDDAVALATSWMPLPALPPAAKSRLEAAVQRRIDRNALEESLATATDAAEIVKINAGIARLDTFINADRDYLEQLAPHTIRFDVHETSPGSKFLVKLGETLSANAEKLAGPIATEIDPAKREERREAAAKEEDTLRIAAVTEAAGLEAAIAEGKTDAIRIARIKSAAACRQLQNAGFDDVVCRVSP